MQRLLAKSKGFPVFACWLLGASCTYMIDPQTTQCSSDSDCKGLGFADFVCSESLCIEEEKPVDPAFACQEEAWPEPNADKKIDYGVTIETLIGSKPFEGIDVLVCPSFDPECKKPLDKQVSDAKGKVNFTLPVGFRGHLFVTPNEDAPNIIPVAAFLFPPPSADPDAPHRKSIVVSNPAVISALAKKIDKTLEKDAGHVIFTAFGCNSKELEQVEVRTSTKTAKTWKVFVGPGGQMDPKRKSTGPSGRGAVLNLPSGFVTVSAFHPDHGKIFEETVFLQPNVMTSVPIIPSPVLE